MSYIDGFVIPVPTGKKEAFRKLAVDMANLFKEYGATRVVECWGNDVPGRQGHGLQARRCRAGRTRPSCSRGRCGPRRRYAIEANQKMREDPRMQPSGDIPFDGKRMIFGGFEILCDGGE